MHSGYRRIQISYTHHIYNHPLVRFLASFLRQKSSAYQQNQNDNNSGHLKTVTGKNRTYYSIIFLALEHKKYINQEKKCINR